jgi:hypothetical protein
MRGQPPLIFILCEVECRPSPRSRPLMLLNSRRLETPFRHMGPGLRAPMNAKPKFRSEDDLCSQIPSFRLTTSLMKPRGMAFEKPQDHAAELPRSEVSCAEAPIFASGRQPKPESKLRDRIAALPILFVGPTVERGRDCRCLLQDDGEL